MKRNYVKMNVDDNHLSFGNFCRLIKDLSKNKMSAMQSETFCILFGVDNINDTTVNNYCVGVRGINDDYKQIYLNYYKKYNDDQNVLLNVISSIISLLDGIINKADLDTINNNQSLMILSQKLYNIAKNDNSVPDELMVKLSNDLSNSNLVHFISEILFFIILEKKQPLYEDEVKVEIIEGILNSTYISAKELQEYLNIKINEDVNYNYHLKKMSEVGNAYTCFEMGMEEVKGLIKGFPRYEEAYKYFLIAINSNYPQAYYMAARLLFSGFVGSKTKEELELSFNYAKKSSELGSIAGTNLVGRFYLNGTYPVKKDYVEAEKYFTKAAKGNYSYAYNNLYTIYKDVDPEKARNYLLKASSLGESWAMNKLGEEERQKGNMKEAYNYYFNASEVPIYAACFYSYYNIAKYFYLNGNVTAGVNKNEKEAMINLNIASDNNIIEAHIELLKIYVKSYCDNPNRRDYANIYKYVDRIESHDKYSDEIKKEVEELISSICDKHINLDKIK